MSYVEFVHKPGPGSAGLETVIMVYGGDAEMRLIAVLQKYFAHHHAQLTTIAEDLKESEDAFFLAEEDADDRCALLVSFPSERDGSQGGYQIKVDYGLDLTTHSLWQLLDKVTTYLGLLPFVRDYPEFLEAWKSQNTSTLLD